MLGFIIPIVSHIVAALYLQKQKYNKLVTALFWGGYAILAIAFAFLFQNSPIAFFGLLLAQFAIFCITTVGPFGEKLFLFLTYANSFCVCLGINLILMHILTNALLQFVLSTAVIALMHVFLRGVLVYKYNAVKKYFTDGWWKIIIVLVLFLVQFSNQYAFNLINKEEVLERFLDFIIFCVIFNSTLIIIFDLVKNASENNKKARENRRLKDIANKDTLTNLQNRLAYMSFAQEKIEDRDDDTSFVFAILDIDNFKSINDTKGHAEGDRVLKLVGKTISEHSKKSDCNSFRIGGDEFVLIFENKKMDEVQGSIRKLNNKLLKNNGITLSYGCSQVDFDGKNPFEEAYKRADSKMYENKQSKKACD